MDSSINLQLFQKLLEYEPFLVCNNIDVNSICSYYYDAVGSDNFYISRDDFTNKNLGDLIYWSTLSGIFMSKKYIETYEEMSKELASILKDKNINSIIHLKDLNEYLYFGDSKYKNINEFLKHQETKPCVWFEIFEKE